jgi:hypothetical protein
MSEPDRPLIDELIEAAMDACPDGEDMITVMGREFGEMLCSEAVPALNRIIERKRLAAAMEEAHRKAERDALKVELEQHLETMMAFYFEQVREENPDDTPEHVLAIIVMKKMQAEMTPQERAIQNMLGEILMYEMTENLEAEADAASRQMQLPLEGVMNV